MNDFPRIMISGQYFHRNNGGGITLSNLFHGWDKKKLAVVTRSISSPTYDTCEIYYQLGSVDFKKRFPFNLKSSGKDYSGIIKPRIEEAPDGVLAPIMPSDYKYGYEKFLSFTGLTFYRSRFTPSNQFLQWLESFKPELLYSQLSSLEEIRIVSKLHKLLQIPIAIHIMDDWPSTISKKHTPQFIWNRVIDRELRQLFQNASVLMSISDAMSEEYFKRYGKNFMAFHNPIDLEHFRINFPTHKRSIEKFRVLYIGRLGTANENSLMTFAEFISHNRIIGKRQVEFVVFTTDVDNTFAIKMSALPGVSINSAIPYRDVPALLKSYDLLLLPLDFSNSGKRFARLSMPTKASEYMISGTPLLVFAPEETAISQFCCKHNCGHCVTKNDESELMTALTRLIINREYRESLSQAAITTARDKFDSEQVRHRFQTVLRTAANNKSQ